MIATYQKRAAIALIQTVGMSWFLGSHTELPLWWRLRSGILDGISLHLDGRGLRGLDLIRLRSHIRTRVGLLRQRYPLLLFRLLDSVV